MENQKNDNLNLLEAVVQNTEMGKNTLEQIVPMTEDAPVSYTHLTLPTIA